MTCHHQFVLILLSDTSPETQEDILQLLAFAAGDFPPAALSSTWSVICCQEPIERRWTETAHSVQDAPKPETWVLCTHTHTHSHTRKRRFTLFSPKTSGLYEDLALPQLHWLQVCFREGSSEPTLRQQKSCRRFLFYKSHITILNCSTVKHFLNMESFQFKQKNIFQ